MSFLRGSGDPYFSRTSGPPLEFILAKAGTRVTAFSSFAITSIDIFIVSKHPETLFAVLTAPPLAKPNEMYLNNRQEQLYVYGLSTCTR